MSRTASILCAAAAVMFGGCSGATLVLKGPISDQCAKTGLRGCETMTEGVLLVIEGDKPGGLKKVALGASDNAPADLKKFVVGLKTLGSIPGVSEYMAPLMEVIAYLEQDLPAGG